MTVTHTLKVGLFGIGLDAYWKQFIGLKEKLESYINIVFEKIKQYDIEVVNLQLIDIPQKAMEAGHRFRQADVTGILREKRNQFEIEVANLCPNRMTGELQFADDGVKDGKWPNGW